jgi:serine/threonine protein kinase
MELVTGEPLHTVIDREFYPSKKKGADAPPPALTVAEKHDVLLQAAQALEYLAPFGLIHRDFRGCNMHMVSRRGSGTKTELKVLDLGIMILSEDGQEYNSNQAVQAFQRKGMDEDKKRRYDWLPWEVRKGADGTGPAVNFSPPAHSFDVFSLGVLALHMIIGRTKTRDFLDAIKNNEKSRVDSKPIGLDPEVLVSMFHDVPEKRPTPRQVSEALLQHSKSEGPAPPLGSRSRSRSRSRSKATSSNGRPKESSFRSNGAQIVPLVPGSDVPILSGSGPKSKTWVLTYSYKKLCDEHPDAQMREQLRAWK